MALKQYVVIHIDPTYSFIIRLDIVSSFFPVMGLVGPETPCGVLTCTDDRTLQGPEVVAQATRVLQLISETSSTVKLTLETHHFGGCAIDRHGEPLPPSTLKACQEADAILMGEFDIRWLKRNSLLSRFGWWSKMGSRRQGSPRARSARNPQSTRLVCQRSTCKLCIRRSTLLFPIETRDRQRC